MAIRPQHPPATPLAEVEAMVPGVLETRGPVGDTVVTGVSLDSRRIAPGDLYVAAPGARAHGATYAAEAVAAGAAAILTDPAGAELAGDALVPVIVVPEPRAVVGALAARLYGSPAMSFRLLGVTGTQGKTTTTRLAEAALQAAGHKAAVVGTIGTRIDGEDVATSLTTPEATDLQALFAVMRERGVEACAMEVSSHALVMGRVDGIVFDVAAFTNLGRDHLDFHADVEDYFRAKASLFTPGRARRALVNVDDPYGRRLAAETTIPVRTYAVGSDTAADADWRADDVEHAADGSAFDVVRDGVTLARLRLRLPGTFNVSNALCAIALLGEAGFDVPEIAVAMSGVPGVPGRIERVDAGQPFLAVVDYAHKPDAVEAVLRALRPQTSGRLVVVIGAGGERDKGKRPLMGEIASRLADVVVVTDDNPRGEDPGSIRASVMAGATASASARAELHEIGDRHAAIAYAVGIARAGDTVVVAGKGHETGQEIAGAITPFDDRVVLREELAKL